MWFFKNYKSNTFRVLIKIFFLIKKNKAQYLNLQFHILETNRKKGILTLLKALDLIKIDKWIFQIDVHEIESLKFYKKIKRYLKNLNKITN